MSKHKKYKLPNVIEEDVLPRDYNMADWKYEKLVEQIREFEEILDDDHEVALKLASFGSSVVMSVTDIGYQNPDILYFYGFVDGKEAQLIQHISQLNFLITFVEREDKSKPARRIGFALPTISETEGKNEVENSEKSLWLSKDKIYDLNFNSINQKRCFLDLIISVISLFL